MRPARAAAGGRGRARRGLRLALYAQARVVQIIGWLRLVLTTGRRTLEDTGTRRQHRLGVGITALLDQHLQGRNWFVGERYTVADLALYGYMQAAAEAGIDTNRALPPRRRAP